MSGRVRQKRSYSVPTRVCAEDTSKDNHTAAEGSPAGSTNGRDLSVALENIAERDDCDNNGRAGLERKRKRRRSHAAQNVVDGPRDIDVQTARMVRVIATTWTE